MKAVRWIAAGVVGLLALVALASLTAIFVFAYTACATPGPNQGLSDAAGVSLALALVTTFATVFGVMGLIVLWDES